MLASASTIISSSAEVNLFVQMIIIIKKFFFQIKKIKNTSEIRARRALSKALNSRDLALGPHLSRSGVIRPTLPISN